ncbi:MAG TPA: hypothetical protein VFL91_10315 [Thermomicrobiales bacterium]|nr:hypothetical protein [Thermomicrobiales bacterium]
MTRPKDQWPLRDSDYRGRSPLADELLNAMCPLVDAAEKLREGVTRIGAFQERLRRQECEAKRKAAQPGQERAA